MKKILRILYQPWKYLVFLPCMVFSTLFAGISAIALASIFGQRAASRICGTIWARFNACATPMLVSVEGKENIDRSQSYVIVSNHQSQFDILVLYGWLGLDIRWVMKQELRKVPALGIASEKIGHIFIDRSNREAAIASLREAKQKVVNGTSVVFFPEGTRSITGELGEFKKGAFVMALDLGLPILPITITGTGKVLPPTTLNLFPGRAKMKIHPPVDVSGYNRENIDKLIADVKNIIGGSLHEKT
ncbi:MAG: lysophospholipid acyltransferase family protein [bacterium]